MEHKQTRNKMGTMSIQPLLLSMGLPMIVSMVLQALYNIVDSYFVSCMPDTAEITHMGEYGVNALTLAFPIQMLMVAIGVGTGVGINSLLSRSLGAGEQEKVNKIAGNAVFLGLCTYVVFLLFGLFAVPAYMRTQTADPIVLEMGNQYLGICTTLSFGIILYTMYEKLLQGTGRTMMSTIAQVSGAVTNIILDPVMIFGLGPCPELGIAGAAYATVIGQCVSLALNLIFHYGFNKDIGSGLRDLRPERRIVREIYQVGLPAIIMQALMSFMTYGVNIIFGLVSSAAVTAYGIYYKIQQFVFFAAFGMNNAMIPIIAFNYGMQDKARVNRAIRLGMLDTLVITGIGLIGLQALAGPICGVFSLTPETQQLCIRAIRIITLGYFFVGANIAYQGIFQALGCGVRSLVLSLVRLILVPLPLAWVLTILAPDWIWAAFPVGELVALFVAILLMRSIRAAHIATMPERSPASDHAPMHIPHGIKEG